MTQKELIELLENKNLVLKSRVYLNKHSTEITDITFNSKECSKNCVFFVKGKNFKTEYLDEAIKKGALLVITENEYELDDTGIVVVSDIRLAMVYIAETFFDKCYESINLTGITGTKGKTTTANYINNIIEESEGTRAALISTNEIYTGKREEESHLTTPEAIDLQRYFKETKESKIRYLTMEVSSQAYKVHRIMDVKFNVGVFLNISEDHISPAEHPNFADYLNCKLEFIKNCETVIINREAQYFDVVKEAAKGANKIITYGTDKSKGVCDYYVDSVEKEGKLTKFKLIGRDYEQTFAISMQGAFNVENAVAAILVAKEYNIDDESIKNGILKTQVAGRMSMFEKDGIKVIVDYAHNKLSFEKFFKSIKSDYPNSNIISVFGAPGEKAFARRKELGEIASAYSNYIYLTADDPQFEEVKDICSEIATYVSCEYEIVEDRTEAIEKAFKNAKKEDILVILAKGSDRAQKIKGKLVPYESDLDIAKRLTN